MMTAAPRPISPDDGVTDPDTGPPALAGAERFLPPTPAEVGRAAALCFQDVHTDAEIAHQLGIVRRTLARWKKRPEFAAAMAALQVWQELMGEASRGGGSRRRDAPGQRSGEDISRESTRGR